MRATGDLQKCHLQFWRIKYHRILSSKNFHRLKVDRLIESSPAGASSHGNSFFCSFIMEESKLNGDKQKLFYIIT